MAPQYKLSYFAIKGLAEPSRLLMKYGGIEFEDDRFEFAEWPQMKESMPFGQVPVLTVDGEQYHQSIAIARYLAKQVKLVGKNDLEDMEIDSIVDTITDLRVKCATYYRESDAGEKEAKKATLLNETIPYYLERLDKMAAKNNGHLACNKMTWADILFLGVSESINFVMGMDVIGKYKNLEAVKNNVLAVPAIKEWVATRPKTDM